MAAESVEQVATPVTIAIPTWNGARTISDAIRSAIAQGSNVDIYLFDNASTDATREIAATHLENSRIRTAPANLGGVENFRRSFDETGGTYFLWLADDDRLDQAFVTSALKVLEQDPAAVGALPTIKMVDSDGELLQTQAPNERLTSARPMRRLLGFLDQSRWSETYALYRRDRLAPAMPMAECYGGDVVLTWRVLLRGRFCTAATSVLYYSLDLSKTPTALAETTAAPGRPLHLHWAKARLWRRLWAETWSDDLPRGAGRAGRLALVLVLPRKTARGHLAEDVHDLLQRVIPNRRLRRGAQRLVTAILLPGLAVRAVRSRLGR